MSSFLKGLVVGFSIAAPVGPVGLLCLRRSVTHGRLAGFVSGLGAATADALYGLVAALGLAAVTRVLVAQRGWLQLAGGLFLLYLGLATLRSAPPAAAGDATAPRLRTAYFSVFALTLANPATILSFLGIFAGLGLGGTPAAPMAGCLLVLGVFLGSAGWWLLLSAAAGWVGHRLAGGRLRILNVASGLTLAAFGAWQLATCNVLRYIPIPVPH